MSKEMNNLQKKMVKYDLEIGVFISLLIVLLSNFSESAIYFIGICVSLVNFLFSSYINEKLLTGNIIPVLAVLISILKIALILAIAIPFIENVKYVSYYMAGFTSHYLIIIVCCILNREGSV